MKNIGYIFTTISIIVFGSIMNGWALSKLWAWFVVRVFELPPLTIAQAIGLALTVSYLTHRWNSESDSDKKPYADKLVELFVISTMKPLMAIGFGAIVKLWL